MRLISITFGLCLLAGSVAAAPATPPAFEALGPGAYKLIRGDFRGVVIREPHEELDRIRVVRKHGWKPGFGQNLIGGVHSRDRGGMVLTFREVRSAIVRLQDAGDQLMDDKSNRKTAKVVVVARNYMGEVVDRKVYAGQRTSKGNGRIIDYRFNAAKVGQEGMRKLTVTVKVGPGKSRGRGWDRGAAGYGDGFTAKGWGRSACPPDANPAPGKASGKASGKGRDGSRRG
jgi:hypothetical protein